MTSTAADLQDTLLVANNLVRLGQVQDAQAVLLAGLRIARDAPSDFHAVARQLSALFERTREAPSALACAWYALDFARMDALDAQVPARTRARSWILRAAHTELSKERLRSHAKAADLFAQDGRWIHAAHQRGLSGAHDQALTTWQRLAGSIRLPYVRALCLVEVARQAWQADRPDTADAACERAVDLLRSTAGWHARQGRPDRAADCHEIVAGLGHAWNRPALVAQANDDRERELRRDFGFGREERTGSRWARVTGDLLSWENAWDITETMADWMTARRSEIEPALSLELLLLAFETEGKPSGAVVYALSRLAHGLGDAGYDATGPLEILSRRRSRAVRVAVARSFGRLPYRRSLRALLRALDDPEPAVVREARQSIAAMRGPKVLGGVLALVGRGAYVRSLPRDDAADATRRAAFSALAGTAEAQDVISSIMRHGGLSDRRLMQEALREQSKAVDERAAFEGEAPV